MRHTSYNLKMILSQSNLLIIKYRICGVSKDGFSESDQHQSLSNLSGLEQSERNIDQIFNKPIDEKIKQKLIEQSSNFFKQSV